MNKKGESIGKLFTLKLQPELKAWIKENAERSGMSEASLVRYILLREKRAIEKENDKI